MSQSRMYVPRKSRFREHRPPRFLHNEIRETASIPVRQVRKDVVFDQGHALLPSPASKSYFRHGRRSQSRGCQYFRGCSGRGDCLEHRRALAREGGGRLPPFQQRTNQWIRRRGAPSRRDSLLRRQQGPNESDDPAKLGVPGATNAFPRSVEGKARRATGTGPLLLQLRQAPRRSEVRTRDPDSGDAGRTRHPARDAQGDLCVRADIRININSLRRDRVRWHSYAGNCHEHSNASGGVATLDGGSTRRAQLARNRRLCCEDLLSFGPRRRFS